MYDIFLVSSHTINTNTWNDFKKKYPLSQKIENVKKFEDISSKAFTRMFWVVWNDIELDSEFDLTKYKSDPWDEKYIHCFINGDKKYLGGVILCPKKEKISIEEFDQRYYENKKEIPILASKPRPYEIFNIETYEDYSSALIDANTEMFWGVWPEIEITDKSVFEIYFDPENSSYQYDKNENHVFLNLFKGKVTYKNALTLFSKNKPVTKKEIDNRFILERKENDRIVSRSKPYDIVFISYNEPNAENNFKLLKKNFSRAMHLSGIKGIHQAHIEAAKLSTTDMFYVVDADAEILETFNFDIELENWEKDAVYVWRSINPINDLVYGYGGVKLLPRRLTLQMNIDSADMTTSISKKFIINEEVSNYTKFNTDPFGAWKSAFRECVKLSAKIITNQVDEETENRLKIWTTIGKDKPFGQYAILGAKMGLEYGKKCQDDKDALNRINNFDWLREEFEKINS